MTAASNPDALSRADERVATKLTRVMKATTSPLGVFTDPPLVCAAVAVVVVVSVILFNRRVIDQTLIPLVLAVAALPVAVAVGVTLMLAGARRRVVEWMASLPFAVDNMNGLLDGVAQHLVVTFAEGPPERDALNERVEAVHEDCFALEVDPSDPEVAIRIGVLDSKLNPAGANHRRYERVVTLVEQALVPLHDEHPIVSVRIE
ncbi:MAG TPA: hypothetical protein ENK57_03015 [Polyangiaceae bacterium]|nr:hypothetical protein [Polyangiaceae bacterium]